MQLVHPLDDDVCSTSPRPLAAHGDIIFMWTKPSLTTSCNLLHVAASLAACSGHRTSAVGSQRHRTTGHVSLVITFATTHLKDGITPTRTSFARILMTASRRRTCSQLMQPDPRSTLNQDRQALLVARCHELEPKPYAKR
jgi:hypothetical protein